MFLKKFVGLELTTAEQFLQWCRPPGFGNQGRLYGKNKTKMGSISSSFQLSKYPFTSLKTAEVLNINV